MKDDKLRALVSDLESARACLRSAQAGTMASKRKSAAARLELETAALEQACAVDIGQPITPDHARDKARAVELVDIERSMRESNQRLRARLAEFEVAAKDIWPLVNEVRAIVADHYPDGSKHDDPEYTRRRSVTAALVRQALDLRAALESNGTDSGEK